MFLRKKAELWLPVWRREACAIGGGTIVAAVLAVAVGGWLPARAGQNANTAETEARPAPATKPQELASSKASARGSSVEVLLLEDGEQGDQPVAKLADNSRCEVCHLNMAAEELTIKHARADVGCAKCHGECDAHIADESWASGGTGTAPDIMYPREKIATGCMECHKAEQIFLKAEKHKPDAWVIAYEVKTCTECHGKHRLPSRKCKWK